MKPITLTISAFGPYAEKTVLNFDELGSQRLFVITGPTGAGKTTIFEAILYALYGKLSKKGMDPASLRCDFLKPDDDALTYVEFIFQIGSKRYRIRRQPKQWVAKKRGTGKREVGQEVVLEGVGHTDFLPLSKIAEVDDKIVELIGLEEEQFKKIVMLPQGAFQEFLISGTKEKSELLRNIFNTGLYDLVLQRLKGRVSKMSDDYERVRMQYQAQCAMLKAEASIAYGEFPTIEEVANLVQVATAEEAKIVVLSDYAKQSDAAYKNVLDTLNKLKQHNEDVRKWQEAVEHKNMLEKQGEKIRSLKLRVVLAEKAERVVPKEERYIDEKAQLQVQRQGLLETEIECQQLEKKCEVAKIRHDQAIVAKQAAEKAYQEVPELSNKLTVLQQYMQKKLELINIQRTYEVMKNKQTVAQQELEGLALKVKRADQAVMEQQKLQKEQGEMQLRLVEYKQHLQENRLHFKKITQALKRKESLEDVLKEVQDAEVLLEKKEKELQQARLQNRQHAAASLAMTLESGQPCPVCGATHHPKVAVDTSENMIEEELLEARDQAQKNYLRVQAISEQEQALIDSEMNELLEMNKKLINMDAVNNYLMSVTEQGKENKQQVDCLEKELDELLKQLEIYENVASELTSLKQQQVVLQQSYTDAVNQLGQAHGILQQSMVEIQTMEAMEGFDKDENVEALTTQIESVQQEYQRANTNFNEAQEAYTKIMRDQAAAESALSEKKLHLVDSERAVRDLAEAFQESCHALFEKESDYYDAKTDIKEKTILNQYIEQYTQAWTQAMTTCDMLEERLNTQKTVVDLHELETKCLALHKELEDANMMLSEQKARCQSNATIIKNIQEILVRFKDLEQEYAVLGQLRDVLDGKNRFNMRFETFAQAYYFESMLEHANARLARMTHGRYSFKRKESIRDGRKQAGLDLDVMDQYTGRSRDVSTLSGGESFKASLALALGLADVVTSESGGVELSTIFIDEGFGTLDDESLDDTVETLLQLQDSGRLVGVISHVAELKERIPAHLVVTSGNRGSHACFEVRE